MSRPLTILCVANVAKDRNSGAAGAEYETIVALRELGHEVDEVWADGVGRRIQHGNLNLLLELPYRYESVVERRMARSTYDVVHVNQPHGYRAARLVQRRWPRTVFIHRSHGWEPRAGEVLGHWRRVFQTENRTVVRQAASLVIEKLLARHDREIVRWADGHIVCSSEDAEFMVTRSGAARNRVAFLPQSAPPQFIQSAAPPMSEDRLCHVLHVGQFAFFKAPMITAAAMNIIGARHARARFTWVASRDHHDAIRRLLSESLARRMELLDWMPQENLRHVYDSAGIFLFPSFFEGSGKVHIEALSRGLCVITTAVGGMRDYVQNGRSGILVPPGDARAVADAALRIMENPQGAQQMSAASAGRAREYSWHRAAVETVAFYHARIAAKDASMGWR